jgi:hypothetical protein
VSQKRTDESGKAARGWRNGTARLAAIALLTTMFFGASAGSASADLLGGILGNGNFRTCKNEAAAHVGAAA